MEKGMTEDEIVGWHHQLNEYEFEQTLGDNGGQRSLAGCSSWCHRVRHDNIQQQYSIVCMYHIFFIKWCVCLLRGEALMGMLKL